MTKLKSTSNRLLYGCLALFGLPFSLAGLAAAFSVVRIGYTAYDVRALLKNKSPVLLAKRILTQTAAEQLKQRLLQLLRHDIK